jgi:hypothetical protein
MAVCDSEVAYSPMDIEEVIGAQFWSMDPWRKGEPRETEREPSYWERMSPWLKREVARFEYSYLRL